MTIAALSVWAGKTVENSGFGDLELPARGMATDGAPQFFSRSADTLTVYNIM
jgi:hypothetical protein